MKLKKIASLALAGVMAVSMLAGCSVKGTGTGNSDVTVNTSSSMTTAANDAQDKDNKVEVAFTADAELTKIMNQMLSEYGKNTTISSTSVATYIDKLTGKGYDTLHDATADAEATEYDGDVLTQLYTVEVTSTEARNEDAAVKLAAEKIDTVIGSLPETTFTSNTQNGKKYYDYSYTGTISDLVAVVSDTGATTYYAVYTLTQTTAVKTFEK